MTTSSSSSQARRRRHHARPSSAAAPSTGRPVAGPLPVGPAARRENPQVRSGCCRTWSSEHRLLGGAVVRTRWHQPVCPDWAER
ncbi:hypothetical protein [Kitasatospora sp. CMC57]|uniref:hypothetical protein n=1 Tax=Kitasatospora sp. CMC57 TaxID=3231513 RepID=UPI0038B4D288